MPVRIIGGVRDSAAVIGDTHRAVDQAVAAWGQETLNEIRAAWTGWKNPTGRSHDAWSLRGPDMQGGQVVIEIVNDVPYVPYVHRAGQGIPALDQIERDLLPAAESRLAASVQSAGATVSLTR